MKPNKYIVTVYSSGVHEEIFWGTEDEVKDYCITLIRDLGVNNAVYKEVH